MKAGGEARCLYLAWKYTGANPYLLYNMRDESYRPIDEPQGDPAPPVAPGRLRWFIYGCALAAFEEEASLAGAKINQRAA